MVHVNRGAVTGCGAPVACKGGSNEAIKKNPIVSAVASSLQSIEKIIGELPALHSYFRALVCHCYYVEHNIHICSPSSL
jgi:hypothetical protein